MARKRSSGHPGLVLLLVVGGVLVSGIQALLRILHVYGTLLLGIAILLASVWAIAKLLSRSERREPHQPQARQARRSVGGKARQPLTDKPQPRAIAGHPPANEMPPIPSPPTRTGAAIEVAQQSGAFAAPASTPQAAPGQSAANQAKPSAASKSPREASLALQPDGQRSTIQSPPAYNGASTGTAHQRAVSADLASKQQGMPDQSAADQETEAPVASKPQPDAPTESALDRSSQPVSTKPSDYAAIIDASRRSGLFSTPEPSHWVAPGQPVAVHGCVIADGMVYVGSDKSQPDASNINPSRNVHFDKNRDCTVAQLGYWPSYSQASAEVRGAYLQWLAGGKKHPDADIGFVFLYFYGLERRALVDAASDPAAAFDLPLIAEEISRLLEIYSGSGSFRGYANSLLGFVQAVQSAGQEPPESPPTFVKSWEIPLALKLGLARHVAQEAPIPGDWAYAWWLAHPETRLKKAAERCPDEFKQLFIKYYQQQHKPGLRLRPNKTKLVAIHRAASPSLPRRQYEHALALPDVTVLTAPMTKLQAAADYCYQALDGYSRHLGRKPDNAGKIDALLELPTLLWPEAMKQPLLKIHGMVSQSGLSLAVKFDKLLSLLPPWETVNKSSYAAFARAVSQIGLGVEPDPLFGGGVPGGQQTVVLFVGEPHDLMGEPTQRFKTAALALHFAATVSLADGEFSVQERKAMVLHMEEWLHLGDGERARLHARLRWLAAEPPGLNGLKKRIEDMPVPAREALGDFLVLVAKADQQVSPAEVKLLERIYKMLGLEVQGLYGKLHTPVTEPVTVRLGAESAGYAIPRPKEAVAEGFGLDMAKVSALQEDSRRVADILHNIFGEEDAAQDAKAGREPQAGLVAETAAEPGLPGLAGEYSEFVRVLVSRSHWTRAELEELAADRSLLLDGALEHINEAAFDRFDQALAEGDDPVEINQELVGELIA